MAIRVTPLLALLAAAITLLAPAAAVAGNASATRTYLNANYALVHAAHTRIHQVESTLRGLLAKVRGECPLAAAGSPEESQSEQLSNEVIGTMVLTAIRLDLPAGRAYVQAVRSLRWSSSSLTRSVHAYADKVARMITLPVPKLCQDVRSWAASGFKALPAATAPFDAAFLASWVSPGVPALRAEALRGRLAAVARAQHRKAGKRHRGTRSPRSRNLGQDHGQPRTAALAPARCGTAGRAAHSVSAAAISANTRM